MTAKKVDANQALIVAALRAAGASVWCTHIVGQGFPDLVASYKNTNYLIEIKSAKGRMTKDELWFHKCWQAPVHIVRTIDEALEAITK